MGAPPADATTDSIEHDSDAVFISEYGFSGDLDDTGEDINGGFEILEGNRQSHDEDDLFISEYGSDNGNANGNDGLGQDNFVSDGDEGMIGDPPMDNSAAFGA
jgi:hypothetical protein